MSSISPEERVPAAAANVEYHRFAFLYLEETLRPQLEEALLTKPVGWVERSDTRQLRFAKMMGFAKGSTHPTGCPLEIDRFHEAIA